MTTVKQGEAEILVLNPLQVLTVTAGAGNTGLVTELPIKDGDALGAATSVTGATLTYGPFGTPMRYKINCSKGVVSVATAAFNPVRPTAPSDFVELFGADDPADAVKATRSVNPAGDDNALLFTAVLYGDAQNAITIAYVDPGANNASLSVAVTSKAITVSLATDSEGVITSTAAQVRTAVLAHGEAAALVAVTIDASDTGSADDGSGVVTAMAAAALTGGAGTGVGTAGTGSRYTNTEEGTLFINTGTLAAPTWTQLAPVA